MPPEGSESYYISATDVSNVTACVTFNDEKTEHLFLAIGHPRVEGCELFTKIYSTNIVLCPSAHFLNLSVTNIPPVPNNALAVPFERLNVRQPFRLNSAFLPGNPIPLP